LTSGEQTERVERHPSTVAQKIAGFEEMIDERFCAPESCPFKNAKTRIPVKKLNEM